VLRVTAIVLCVLIAPRSGDACTCMPRDSLEMEFSESDVVFVGTVGDTTTVDAKAREYDTTFAVGEVLRGSPGRTAVVRSTWDGASCEYGPFVRGTQMLVYATTYANQLHVSVCSFTKRLADAGDELVRLRRLAKQKVAVIEGAVLFDDDVYFGSTTRHTPRANVEVRARGTTYAAHTGSDGRYRLELPPGTYKLDVQESDPTLTLDEDEGPVALPRPGSYAERYFIFTFDGRLSGQLQDHRGKPASGVAVRAMRGAQPGPSTRTDAHGRYQFSRLPPGTYRIAAQVPEDPPFPIPPTMSPPVELGRAGRVTTDLRLGRPPTIFRLTGGIQDPDPERLLRITIINTAANRRNERHVLGAAKFEVRDVPGSVLDLTVCDAFRDTVCASRIRVVLDRDRKVMLASPP
jgi:hypothetical protein